ncbi:MAG: hypothetical protein K6F33_10710 [Bacteroidales bacterium]|nr:hypothetical protein [Bacteroidales bacterium]
MNTIYKYILLIATVCFAACEEDGITSMDTADSNKTGDYWNVPYDTSGTAYGHVYVDIGVSVLWSTFNIGSTHPLMPGSYFAWGEIEPKDSYTWATYAHCDKNHALTKYNYKRESGSNGFVDSIYTLKPEDDAAVQNWGNGWRMPTKPEFDELRNDCTWEWIQGESANYYKVTGPNGKSILLPACGCIKDTKRIMFMENGCIWSASVSINIPEHGYELTQYATGYWIGSADRFYGEPIRPVISREDLNKKPSNP